MRSIGLATSRSRWGASHQHRVILLEDQQGHHFSLVTVRSHLAMINGLSLMQEFQLTSHFYRDLCNTREVRMLFINKWVELSFCLLHKLNKKHFLNIPVECNSIFERREALTLNTPYCCSEPTGPALYWGKPYPREGEGGDQVPQEPGCGHRPNTNTSKIEWKLFLKILTPSWRHWPLSCCPASWPPSAGTCPKRS